MQEAADLLKQARGEMVNAGLFIDYKWEGDPNRLCHAYDMAIAALQAQVPRVLSYEELIAIHKPTPVWVERIALTGYKEGRWEIFSLNAVLPALRKNYNVMPKHNNQMNARAWTHKPTAEQMSATPWDKEGKNEEH